jgi:IS5 family transposase
LVLWFKLHIIINDKAEILNFTITQANIDDRTPLKSERFLVKIYGKLYADKGYIGKDLMQLLFADGLHLITHIISN